MTQYLEVRGYLGFFDVGLPTVDRGQHAPSLENQPEVSNSEALAYFCA